MRVRFFSDEFYVEILGSGSELIYLVVSLILLCFPLLLETIIYTHQARRSRFGPILRNIQILSAGLSLVGGSSTRSRGEQVSTVIVFACEKCRPHDTRYSLGDDERMWK